MANPMQVKVGVALDPSSKAKLISEIEQLKGDPILIKVDADTSNAKATLDKFIANYRNKDIKLNIDANIDNGILGGGQIAKSATRIKNSVEKAFKGIKIGSVLDFSGLNQQAERLKSEFKSRFGNDNMSVEWHFDSEDAHSGVTMLVRDLDNATASAQKLHYSMEQIGGKPMYILDHSEISVIDNASKALDRLQTKVNTMRDTIQYAKNSGKLSEDGYQASIQALEQAEKQLESLKRASLVTTENITSVNESLRKTNNTYKEQLKSQAQVNESLNQEAKNLKQLESDYLKLQKMQQGFDRWLTSNSKAMSLPGVEDLQTRLKEFQLIYDATESIDTDALRKLNLDIESFKTKAQSAGKAGMTAFDQITSKAKELGSYLLANFGFEVVSQTISTVIQNVRELDSAMVELKKTTEGSSQDYINFFNQAADTAQQVGSKVSDVIQSAAEWSRSGYNLQQSGTLAKAASIYLNVSEYENITDATQSMISSMKAYGVAAEDVMTIVDKFNAVGNTTATSSSGLGDALMRSASALATAGNTIDESLGLVVAANNTVQNPEKVGNGLKTIALRLRNTKGELEELGEESDGAVESITKLQTQLLNATHGQVNIFDNAGQFKSTYEILSELANVWGELDSVEQANITTMLAGATQANTFSSIMQNMGEGAKAVQTSLTSSGSAMEENSRYMDSIEGKLAQLSSTFQELSANLLSSDLFKGVVSGATTFLNVLNEIVSTVGVLVPLLAGGAIAAFIKNLD